MGIAFAAGFEAAWYPTDQVSGLVLASTVPRDYVGFDQEENLQEMFPVGQYTPVFGVGRLEYELRDVRIYGHGFLKNGVLGSTRPLVTYLNGVLSGGYQTILKLDTNVFKKLAGCVTRSASFEASEGGEIITTGSIIALKPDATISDPATGLSPAAPTRWHQINVINTSGVIIRDLIRSVRVTVENVVQKAGMATDRHPTCIKVTVQRVSITIQGYDSNLMDYTSPIVLMQIQSAENFTININTAYAQRRTMPGGDGQNLLIYETTNLAQTITVTEP